MQTQEIQSCSVCGFQIEFDEELEENEIIDCFDCGTEFEVTSLDPFVIEELEAVAEDWGQ